MSELKTPLAESATTLEALRKIALALPGVEEGTSYGTVSFRVRKKILARVREDGESLVMKMDDLERDFLLLAKPDVYFTTDHYVGWPMVLIHLSKIHPDDLAHHFRQAWRSLAPKKLVTAFDKEHAQPT